MFAFGFVCLGLFLSSCELDPTTYPEANVQTIPLRSIQLKQSHLHVDFNGAPHANNMLGNLSFPVEGQLQRLGDVTTLSLSLQGALDDTLAIFFPNLTATRVLGLQVELQDLALQADTERQFFSSPSVQESDTLISIVLERMRFIPPFKPDTVKVPTFATITLRDIDKNTSNIHGTIQLYALLKQPGYQNHGVDHILYTLNTEVEIK